MGKRKREGSPRSGAGGKKRARRVRQAKGKPSVDPVILLHVLARMLNECERQGVHPKLKHGIVYTDVGYVLDVRDGKWAARPLKPK